MHPSSKILHMTYPIAIIPKKVTGGKELVVMRRKDYDELLKFQKIRKSIIATSGEHALKRAVERRTSKTY